MASTSIVNGRDNSADDPRQRAPLILNDRDFHDVTEIVLKPTEAKTPMLWYPAFAASVVLLAEC